MAPGNRRISITISARNQASRAFRQLQADIQKTNTAATNLSKTTAAGSRTVDRLSSSLQRGSRSANTYAGTISNVHGQVIALSIAQRGLNDALNVTAISQARAAINLERLQVALQTISGSTAAATAQYERLVEVARLPGINLENSLRASTQLQAIGKSGQEATTIIREFGNALALSSQSPRELRQTIRGLSQLSTVGSVLQEDLEIITSRISVLNRGLKELGGPRAEGIRKFYDALGVPPDQQGPRLVEDMLRILSELPRAGNTAANAIENLFDTTERAQATIGRNFLPIIRESTSALEGLAARIEKNPELARTIALFETFAGTLGTVALAIAGVGVALAFLGPALIATFTNPFGLAALAVGALAAAVLTWKVANESAQQPLQDLNPLIERNTELIDRNRRAKEENNRSELQATGQSLQDAIGQIQRRIEVIRQAGAEAQEVLARLDDRLQNLQGARGRQTSQLAVRVEEEFDAAFIATRGFSEELTKAESELQRLTETAEATDAITDGFQEADQAAENLRETINKLGKEISEGASTDNLRASLSGQNVDPKTLLGDLVDVQSALNRVSETYDEIASNAGDSEAAQTQLAEIQGVLTGATERYLDALSQSLALTLADTDAKESDFEEIQRLAQGYTDYYQGRGDAFQAYVDRAEGLAERAVAAIGQLDLAERAEDAQKEAARVLAEAERQQIAAVKAVIAEEEAAYNKRIGFTRRQQTETTQAYRTSDRIQRDLLTERTNAEEESAENAIDAVNERAEASEAAAGRVTDRWLDAIDERERAEERADRDAARREQQAERRRERQAEREARRLERTFTNIGAGIARELESAFDVGFLESGIRAALGDPSAFLQEFFGGLIESLQTPDLTVPEHLRTPSITEPQLASGQFGQTRGERFRGEFGGGRDIDQLNTPITFDQPLVVDLGFEPDQLQREPLTKNELIDIYERYRIPHNLERTAKNTRETSEKIDFDRVSSILNASTESLERALRDDADSPLQDILDNRQGLLRLFSAEKIDAFLVGANDLIQDQRELARQQRREQDPDFAFIDDLRSLLEVAEVPEEERATLLDRFEEALERDFIGQEDRNELVEALVDVFDRFNINADVGDSFTSRFADLLPVWDDIRLSSEESAAYLRELRDFLLAQGVPEASIEPLIAQFERAFADNVVNFREGQNLFGQLNTLLSEFNIPELSLDEFGAGLADGLEATFDNLTLTAELGEDQTVGLDDDAKAGLDEDAKVPVDGQEFIDNLRSAFRNAGIPADVFEPLLTQLETLFTQDLISQDAIDAVTTRLAELLADASIPIEISEDVVAELQRLLDDATIQVEDTSERFIAVEDTTEREIPFAGVPDETMIAVEPTDERVIAVEDKTFTVDGTDFLDRLDTILTPEAPQAPATEGARSPDFIREASTAPGGPRPNPPAGTFGFGDTARYTPTGDAGVANQYSAGELEILARIGEEDASLPISQENLEILLGEGSVIAQGLSNLAIATQMPVNLAEGTTESLAMAISGETLKVTPSGQTMPVSGQVDALLKGRIAADVQGRVSIDGAVETIPRGVQEVRIVDVNSFLTSFADEVTRRIDFGESGIPSG